MRFGNYLNEYGKEYKEKSRVKEITEDQLVKLLKSKAKRNISSFIKSQSPAIFRGSDTDFKYGMGDGRKSEPRVSRNTKNYYTLWMDDDPKWKDYPKRSKSFICTNDESYADSFGRWVNLIIPYDGVKIGRASSGDFWSGFRKGFQKVGWQYSDLSDFAEGLDYVFSYLLDIQNADASMQTFDKAIDELDKLLGIDGVDSVVKRMGQDTEISSWRKQDIMNFLGTWDGSLRDMMSMAFDPQRNDVQLFDYTSMKFDRKECWLEGPALFINLKYFSEKGSTYGDEVVKAANQFREHIRGLV